ITEEAVRAEYDAFVEGFEPQDEIRASHILIPDGEGETAEAEAKAKAEAIKAEIEGGADFATLAQENSVDTQSAVNGGDLGFFRRGMMVQPFEEAAFGLTEVGSVSEPVRSQYGW